MKDPEKAKQIADRIIKNTYKVLMTRGLRGCYIYCEDKPMAEFIKGRIKSNKNYQYSIDEEEQIEYLQVADPWREMGHYGYVPFVYICPSF